MSRREKKKEQGRGCAWQRQQDELELERVGYDLAMGAVFFCNLYL